MNLADKLTAVANNIPQVYKAGFDNGHLKGTDEGFTAGKDVGKQEECDRFWGKLQNYGKNQVYSNAFSYGMWTDETFNPQYPFVTNSCNAMFMGNPNITDTKMPIDISAGGQTYYLFQGASAMKTIRELIVADNRTWTDFFTGCKSLEYVRIKGVVSKNISFADSPLDRGTIRHLVNILSYTATGQTITFKKSAKEAAFTDDEWNLLISDHPNWTFSLV